MLSSAHSSFSSQQSNETQHLGFKNIPHQSTPKAFSSQSDHLQIGVAQRLQTDHDNLSPCYGLKT